MKDTNMSIDLAGIPMKNPVMVASGTFGLEYADYFDLRELGAMVTQAITPYPKEGNPPPRIRETPAGMLNSVGLENLGVDAFIRREWPEMSGLPIPVIVNIGGDCVEEYVKVANALSHIEGIAGLEVNISCPNVALGGLAFGQDPESAYDVISAVRETTSLPLIAKLTPNVSHIQPIASAAEEAGADAISLINTLLGMAIDTDRQKPVFHRTFAGLSGPAVKPVALRMVWEVYEAVKVPIVGMGGICSPRDALEFLLAGATAVSVGTANFVNPKAAPEIVEGIGRYLAERDLCLSDIIGAAHEKRRS